MRSKKVRIVCNGRFFGFMVGGGLSVPRMKERIGAGKKTERLFISRILQMIWFNLREGSKKGWKRRLPGSIADGWLCVPGCRLRNRNVTIGAFVLKRLFMLPRHSRQYAPSFVPDPSLGPHVLDILVRPCIDVCSISAFPTS
jgi:hypothetical protein